ncbi:unnamed protein product, partial [Effrenium voratum]
DSPALGLATVDLDGDCLFHALAVGAGGSGPTLRQEVADFLEAKVVDEPSNFQDEWLTEAERLRRRLWGGAASCVAFSLMRGMRVISHSKIPNSSAVEVVDLSHRLVDPGAPKVHILYNGSTHYDALVRLESTLGWEPAWPQTGRPRYFKETTAARPVAANGPSPREIQEQNLIGDSLFGVETGDSLRERVIDVAGAQEEDGEADSSEAGELTEEDGEEADETEEAEEAGALRRRRCRQKTTPPPELREDVMEEVVKAKVAPAEQTAHPLRHLEEIVKLIAETKIRADPTLPPGRASAVELDAGAVWPRAFCAFVDCDWAVAEGTEADLQLHLAEAHSCDLMAGARLLLRPGDPSQLMSIYNALARRCRQGAPLAGCSLDRTALRSFAAAVEGDKVEALICVSCACIYSRVAELEEQNEIQWRRILSRCGGEEEGEWRLFGQPAPRVVEILGLNAFLDKYDKLHSERECETPVCRACFESLKKKKMPPVSLANDMWVGYSPERIFEEKMTVLELICASPCATTMVCMSMEARHRHASAPFDETAHMARHRYGFRGNPLTFPLPWEDLMRELQSVGEEAAALPRAGVQLSEVVRVLLKTNQHGQTSEAEIKTLIHQANVRREVAVNLILDMKRLGHPSFIGADEDAVRARAAALPEDGAPPEVLRVVTLLDGSEKINDKLLPQKAATPVDGRSDAVEAGRIFAAQRPRGVVAEGEQALDLNQTQIAAMRRLQDELTSDAEKALRSLEVRTGNQLVDQFQPLYFAVAFCFCFKFGTARPDVKNEVKGEARDSRRAPGAPQVDIHAWAAAMQRRVESQFRRDWNFGSIWNYIFRTAVNLQKNVYMYSIPDESNPERRRPMTGKEVLKGASDLLRALDSKYADVSGELKAVKGDLAKTRSWRSFPTTTACAEGFRVLVLLALRHLLGVRFCPRCPDCAASDSPCADAFGSDATATGGVLGRVDAVYGSIECQKAGSLHGHFQVFVQCFHQHTPLSQLMKLEEEGGVRRLFQKYASYSAHARPGSSSLGRGGARGSCLVPFRYRRSVYCRPDLWQEGLRETVEADWPEYKDSSLMLSRPAYQTDASMSPADWKARFLEVDVEELQQRKQHHVHLPGPDGQRQPLAHCQDKFELPVKGKRSLLGVCWGPVNKPNLNGNHPAFLAALRCNGDLQLPYRFPITTETHSDSLCEENCAGRQAIRLLIREAQLTQAAQAGYACDYMNKRLAIARAEIQEWQRGQRDLAADLEDKPVGYLAARSNKRLITDIYSRGVCRGAVECCNLIVNSGKNDPTSAETIKTAPVTDISLSFGLRLMEAAATGEPWPVEPRRQQPDKRDFGLRQTVSRPAFWTFYGSRGKDPRVFELSAFEFARRFQCAVARHPRKVADLGCEGEEEEEEGDEGRNCGAEFHAYLTDEGQKILARLRRAALLPGTHYRVKDLGGEDWVALSDGALGQTFRHDWVAVLRRRPNVPVVQGALGSRCDEDTAKKVLLLFFPWTNDPSEATSRVPYLSSFKAPGVKTWRHALRFRLLRDGFPTEEVKQFAQNFCFVYGLPRELQPSDKLEENSDNEFEDEPMEPEEEDLLAAQATCIKGAAQPGEAGGEEEEDAEAQRIARTEQMFQLSKEVWGGAAASGEGDPSFAQHYADMAAKQAVEDHDELEEAAKASRAKGEKASKGGANAKEGPGVSAVRPLVTKAGLLGWLEAKRPNLNAKQQEILALVVERVLIECGLLAPEESSRQSGEPLVWLLHGPPGAGKSHVLKYLRELFEEQLGYVQGIDYEVAAFQAVNAADIKGKTIHNVCGLSADWKAVDRAVSKEAKRMGLWRWLIIDEVSMVNARLLAQVDQRLRSAVPDAAAWKLDPSANSSRPFAGINVLFTGDFYQLPPPSGAYLGDVPYNRRPRAPDDLTAPDPLADYGRELFWGGAVQGVTELEERERCKDGWWNAVVDELRAGHLSQLEISPWAPGGRLRPVRRRTGVSTTSRRGPQRPAAPGSQVQAGASHRREQRRQVSDQQTWRVRLQSFFLTFAVYLTLLCFKGRNLTMTHLELENMSMTNFLA